MSGYKAIAALLSFVVIPTDLYGRATALDAMTPARIIECGYSPAEPIHWPQVKLAQRPCDKHGVRHYVPKHKGLAFKILAAESDVCFVPDSAYQLLDRLVGETLAKVGPVALEGDTDARTREVIAIGRATADVLIAHGFALNIPTNTLADALTLRNDPQTGDWYSIDCDTASMIVLTVAEALRVPASLVEMTYAGDGKQHNFVRFHIDDQHSVNWDTNGQEQCRLSEPDLPPYQGIDMTTDATMGYVYRLLGQLAQELGNYPLAAREFQRATDLYPSSPSAYNSLAWLISTREFTHGAGTFDAVQLATKATGIQPNSDNYDTLACAFALAGDYEQARQAEGEAISRSKTPEQKAEFANRLSLFTTKPYRNCIGVAWTDN